MDADDALVVASQLKDADRATLEQACHALHAEVLRLRARVEQLEPFLAVVPCPNPSEHGDADRRFEESLELIRERYGEAIELLGKGHDGEGA